MMLVLIIYLFFIVFLYTFLLLKLPCLFMVPFKKNFHNYGMVQTVKRAKLTLCFYHQVAHIRSEMRKRKMYSVSVERVLNVQGKLPHFYVGK